MASDRKYTAFDLIAIYENRSFETSLSRSQGRGRVIEGRYGFNFEGRSFTKVTLQREVFFLLYAYGSRVLSLASEAVERFLLPYPI